MTDEARGNYGKSLIEIVAPFQRQIDELERDLAKAHIKIRQLREEAVSAFFRGVAVGGKEARENG